MPDTDQIIAALEKERRTLQSEGNDRAAMALEDFIENASGDQLRRFADFVRETVH